MRRQTPRRRILHWLTTANLRWRATVNVVALPVPCAPAPAPACASPRAAQVAAAVEAQLDIYASAALEDPEHGEQELECLQGYYNEAMELEFNFFDSQQVGDEGLEQSRETVGMMMQNMMSNIIEQQGEELQ